MPRVSVCMLAYNHARQMKRSLDCLLNEQTFNDFELIISDDCSPDPEMELICREYVETDKRVRYFRNQRNIGRIPNYNVATSQASGEYIAIVHDGDLYRPNLLERWVYGLDKYPRAGLVFNSLEAVDWQGNHIKYYYHDYPELIQGTDLVDEMLRRYDSPVFGMTMFRSSCFSKAGLFDNQFDIIGDVDMWMRIALISDVVYIREPLIGVLPRETNHDTQVRLWETLYQNEQIHRVNAKRRYWDNPEALQKLERHLDQMFNQLWVRSLLSCAKLGNRLRLGQGIRFLVDNRRGVPAQLSLRVLMHILTPFAVFE